LGLFITLYLISRFKQREGTLSACFIIFYCIYRFVIEYFREADSYWNYFYLNHFTFGPAGLFPETPWWLVLTMGQILCIAFLIFGLVLLLYSRYQILEGSPDWLKRNKEFFERQALQEKK
jgi:prolipoprotein diacylglyceryltransferase